MPIRHQASRREASHSSMARNIKGIQGMAQRMLRCPAGTWRKYGAQNISTAADTKPAKGCKPRRQAHRYMKAPSNQAFSAMLQFVASGSGKARQSQFPG